MIWSFFNWIANLLYWVIVEAPVSIWVFVVFFRRYICVHLFSILASPAKQCFTGNLEHDTVDTHHITEGVAKEDCVAIEQGSVSAPLTRLTGNTHAADYHHLVMQHIESKLVTFISMSPVSKLHGIEWDYILKVGPLFYVQAGNRQKRGIGKHTELHTYKQTYVFPHWLDIRTQDSLWYIWWQSGCRNVRRKLSKNKWMIWDLHPSGD